MGAALAELKYSEAVLEVALRPSRLAAACLAWMGAATLALIALTPGPAGLRILAATAVACAALEAIHRVAWHRGPRGVRTLFVRRSREVDVEMASGRWNRGRLRDGCFVSPWLTIIRWRREGVRCDSTVLILQDMVGAEDFRTLRVLLRWGQESAGEIE